MYPRPSFYSEERESALLTYARMRPRVPDIAPDGPQRLHYECERAKGIYRAWGMPIRRETVLQTAWCRPDPVESLTTAHLLFWFFVFEFCLIPESTLNSPVTLAATPAIYPSVSAVVTVTHTPTCVVLDNL